jgi:hypothetical protein
MRAGGRAARLRGEKPPGLHPDSFDGWQQSHRLYAAAKPPCCKGGVLQVYLNNVAENMLHLAAADAVLAAAA